MAPKTSPTDPQRPNSQALSVETSHTNHGPGRALLRTVLTWAIAGGVFLIYLATGAPGAWWGDGQELACAAWTLGIPHPTGYPLYMLTSHVVMKTLGWLDPGRALTIYSALLLAASFGLLIPLFRRILNQDPAPAGSRPVCECDLVDLLPAAGVALLIAFSRTLWEHATFAEVYPFTFFLGVLILLAAWTRTDDRVGTGRAALLGLSVGLAALNHYSFLALGPLAFFCLLRWMLQPGRTNRTDRQSWTMFLAALICFGAMLLGYLYLPLRAQTNPPLNWGDPSTLERLRWVLSGGQFAQLRVDPTAETVLMGLVRWIYWWGSQWLPQKMLSSPLGLALGLALLAYATWGLIILARQRWDLGYGLLMALAATAGFSMLYQIPDIDAYFLIALPAAAIGWIVATQTAIEWLRRKEASFMRGPLFRTLPALLALAALLINYRAVDKSWDDGPTQWGKAVMDSLPKDALVITGGDTDIYSLWYQQMVLGQRPDVTVFGSKFIFSGWYAKYFEHADRPKIPLFIEDRPPGDKLVYDIAFFGGIVLPNLAQGRPVFVTYTNEPLYKEYFSPKPSASLIAPDYGKACAYPFGLPSPVLFQLERNPLLETMSREDLAQEFRRFYQRVMKNQ